MKFIHKLAISLLIFILFFFLTFTIYGNLFAIRSHKIGVRTLYVPKGATLQAIARKLEEKGLIRNRTFFILASKILLSDRKIMAGEYIFPEDTNVFGIISSFKEGKVYFKRVTIPAGYTVEQIGRLLERDGIVSKTEFLTAVKDRDLIKLLGVEDINSLEGFLYPDTYYFLKDEDARDIVKKMIGRFKHVFTPQMAMRAIELNMSIKNIITLASIVEKEAAIDRERPIIAAVFYNRLKRNMPLQSDPTVIYALGNRFRGNLKKVHLLIRSPYNTYKKRGLPPGPICSPSIKSIKAVLYPANVDYLYFVSKNNGTHYFSRTLREHNRAVYKYQKKIAYRRHR